MNQTLPVVLSGLITVPAAMHRAGLGDAASVVGGALFTDPADSIAPVGWYAYNTKSR